MARRRRRARSPGRGPEARVDRIGPSDKHRHVKDEAARERGAWDAAQSARGRALAAATVSGGALALRSLGAQNDDYDGDDTYSAADGLLGGGMRARLRWDLPSRQLSVDVSQVLAAEAASTAAAAGTAAAGDAKPSGSNNPARRALAALGSRLEARYRGVLNAGTGAYEYRGTLARHFDTPGSPALAAPSSSAAAAAAASSSSSSSSSQFLPAGWGTLLGTRDWRLSPGVSVTSCPARGPPAFAGGRANAFNNNRGGGAAAAAAALGGLGGAAGGNNSGSGRLAYVLTARKLPQVVRRTRTTDVWLTGKVCGAVEPARLQAPGGGGGGGGEAAGATATTATATATTAVELPAALGGGFRVKAYRYGSGDQGSARRRDLRLSVGLDWAATGLRLRAGGGGGAAADAEQAAADADADAAAATALLLGGAADAAIRPLGAGGAAEDGDALEWALDTALSGGGGGGGGAAAAAAAATSGGGVLSGGGSGPRRRGPGGALWRAWPYVKVSADAWSVRLQRGRLAVLYEI